MASIVRPGIKINRMELVQTGQSQVLPCNVWQNEVEMSINHSGTYLNDGFTCNDGFKPEHSYVIDSNDDFVIANSTVSCATDTEGGVRDAYLVIDVESGLEDTISITDDQPTSKTKRTTYGRKISGSGRSDQRRTRDKRLTNNQSSESCHREAKRKSTCSVACDDSREAHLVQYIIKHKADENRCQTNGKIRGHPESVKNFDDFNVRFDRECVPLTDEFACEFRKVSKNRVNSSYSTPACVKSRREYLRRQNSTVHAEDMGVANYDKHGGSVNLVDGEQRPPVPELPQVEAVSQAMHEERDPLVPREARAEIHAHEGPGGQRRALPLTPVTTPICPVKSPSAEIILSSDAGDRADKKFDDKISDMLNESAGNVSMSKRLIKRIKNRVEKIADKTFMKEKTKKAFKTQIPTEEEPEEKELFLLLLYQTTQHQEQTMTPFIYHFYNLLTQKIRHKQLHDGKVTLAEYAQHLKMDDLLRSWRPTVEATKSLKQMWNNRAESINEKERYELQILMGDMCEKSKAAVSGWRNYRKEESVWLYKSSAEERNRWVEDHINTLHEFITNLLLDIKTMLIFMHMNEAESVRGKLVGNTIDKIILQMPNKYLVEE